GFLLAPAGAGMGETGMRRIFAALALATLTTACGSTPEPEPVPTVAPPPPVVAAPSTRPDQCGAAALQGLVGRPRSEIPVPVNPDQQRVACAGCPLTLDFNPRRLTFLFDADTGRIREVRCG